MAAKERKGRVIADVWAAIAERKRKREEDSTQKHETKAQAKQCRQDEMTEMTSADGQDASGGKRETGKACGQR